MNRLFKHSLAFVFLFGFGLASQGQTLHAILMADENDAKIGQSCRKDLNIMSENMQQISNGIGYQLNVVQLSGLNFTALTLREAIQKLQVEPHDLVFFYYSGHGYNIPDNVSNYPYLNVINYTQAPISLDEIEQLIQAKKPRLCITLGDCCNKVMEDAKSSRGIAKPRTKEANSTDQVKVILQQLFLTPSGSIKISSSKKGQYSWTMGANGSAYSFAFESAFEDCLLNTKQAHWETLLKDTQQRLSIFQLVPPQNSIFDIHLTDSPAVVVIPPPSDTTVVIPTPPTPPEPQPSITYADLNAFLGMIADESRPTTERQKAKARLNEFFVPNAHVKLFVNDTEVESQRIEQLFGRLYLNAAKISEVNVIQKASVFDPTRQRYTVVAVQEVWDK